MLEVGWWGVIKARGALPIKSDGGVRMSNFLFVRSKTIKWGYWGSARVQKTRFCVCSR